MKNGIYISVLILIVSVLVGCGKKKTEEDPNVFYTCSMDPQVMEKKPGKCPICKMELTRTVLSPNQDKESIKLSDTQIRLGNIRTEIVQTEMIGEGLSLRGTLVPDERKADVISSRVPGRIDKLYFKNDGETIRAGDKVYDIYSEELQAAIKQYLLLKEKAKQLKGGNIDYQQMLQSAKDKLIVWGLTESQINSLTQSNASSLVSFYSKVSGVINEVSVTEGAYVNEGSPVLKVEDYSSLWVEAEVYPQDVKFIQQGLNVKVLVEAFSNEQVEGKISFENPVLESGSRINLVRVEIPNSAGKYKPGMRAVVTAFPSEKKAIAILEEAVLFQPDRNTVWVAAGEGVFKPKMVEAGITNNGKVEIKSGLKEGDTIVTSGVYLIDSEYRLRKGSVGMADIDHGSEKGKPATPLHQH